MRKRKFELIGTCIGLVLGLILGLVFGAGIGIATGGTAIGGTLPCIGIGLVVFALIGNKIGSEIDRRFGK